MIFEEDHDVERGKEWCPCGACVRYRRRARLVFGVLLVAVYAGLAALVFVDVRAARERKTPAGHGRGRGRGHGDGRDDGRGAGDGV